MSPSNDEFPKIVSLREWADRKKQSSEKETTKSAKNGGGGPPTGTGKPPARTAAVIGDNIETGNPVAIGDIERRSSLYVLGKPGMGKSTLLVNLISQDIDTGRSTFFLDPHGEAIRTVFLTSSAVSLAAQSERVYLLDPADEEYSFGINPLFCNNLSSRNARNAAFNKAYNIFKRVWESDNQWGLWLSLILRNTLPVLIETQQTLAEMPLFLNNRDFREYLLGRAQYNASAVDFWKYEFKPEQAQPALVRVRALLGEDDYVRDIVGQQKTTIDFQRLTTDSSGRFLFLRLPPNLNDETGRFIGTIVTTELLHAIRERSGDAVNDTYCLYVDEFQHFATDQFAEFINEGRKFGCATTITHQERLGQFNENQKVLGATLACANKVLFQVTVKDARELAPEFAQKPTFTETRKIPELVISKEPVWDLVSKGHPNKRIQWLVDKYLRAIYEFIWQLKETIEEYGGLRLLSMDEALLSRDQASIYGAQDRASPDRMFGQPVSSQALVNMEMALQNTLASHSDADSNTRIMLGYQEDLRVRHGRIRELNKFLSDLMEGRTSLLPGQEALWQYLRNVYVNVDFEKGGFHAKRKSEKYDMESESIENLYAPVYFLYWQLQFGDPTIPRQIPPLIAGKYYREEVNEVYRQNDIKRTIERASANTTQSYRVTLLPQEEYVKECVEWAEKRASHFAKQEFYEKLGELYYDTEPRELNLPNQYPNKIVVSSFRIPDLPKRVLNGEEIKRLKDICIYELLEQAKKGKRNMLTVTQEILELANLLTDPENYVKVPSGVYKEVAINVSTTAEMVNQAVQTLTELPRYTAYAKTITQEGREEAVWKGQIKTLPAARATNDPDVENEIIELTRRVCCKTRDAVEQEIVNRRTAWRRPEPPQPPEGGPGRQPEKTLGEPPHLWDR